MPILEVIHHNGQVASFDLDYVTAARVVTEEGVVYDAEVDNFLHELVKKPNTIAPPPVVPPVKTYKADA